MGHNNPVADVVNPILTLPKTIFDFNKNRIAQKREARTAADQQKDAMISKENELKKNRKEGLHTASNLAIRQKLISERGYNSAARRGTVFTSPTGIPGASGTGGKMLLGE